MGERTLEADVASMRDAEVEQLRASRGSFAELLGRLQGVADDWNAGKIGSELAYGRVRELVEEGRKAVGVRP